jgi:4-amino-4-deoxy-L-arabinose transferase-like glycosyltransferase
MKKSIIIISLLSALINSSIGAFIYFSNPAYFTDYTLNENPDADHYVLLGINLLTKGTFSRMDKAPYSPDLLRTPVYPLLAGIMSVTGKAPWLLYIFHVILQTATAILLLFAGRILGSLNIGFIAALAYILDHSLAGANFEALSEPTFNFFMTGTILLSLHYLKGTTSRLRTAFLIGLLLGITILTRPTALFIPPIIVIVMIFDILKNHPRPEPIWKSKRHPEWIALVLGTIIVVGPWIIRNKIEFDIPKLTNVDAMNYVYYLGAGGYQIHYGIPLEAAQDSIAREFNLSTNLEHHNPWMVSKSIKELDTELRQVIRPVLLKYPLALLKSIITGLVKSSIAHNVALIAYSAHTEWINPGLDNIVHGHFITFAKNCLSNKPLLIYLFLFQTAFMPIFWIAVIMGIIIIARNRNFQPMFVLLLLIGAYFLLTMVLGGLDATHRFRVVILPTACLIIGYGLDQFFHWKTLKKN